MRKQIKSFVSKLCGKKEIYVNDVKNETVVFQVPKKKVKQTNQQIKR